MPNEAMEVRHLLDSCGPDGIQIFAVSLSIRHECHKVGPAEWVRQASGKQIPYTCGGITRVRDPHVWGPNWNIGPING